MTRWTATLRKPRVGLLLAFGLMLAACWQVGRDHRARTLTAHRARLEARLTYHSNILTSALHRRVALLEGLAALVMTYPSQTELATAFQRFAGELYASETGIRNFVGSPGGINRFVYPLRVHDAVLGHNQIEDQRPVVRAAIERTLASRRVVVSGPYELRVGGQGFVARKAVYHDDKFWGLVSMALDVPPLLQEAGLVSTGTDLDMALRDASGQVFVGSTSVFQSDPIISRIRLPDGYWELAAAPSRGWDAEIRGEMAVFLGGLIAIALSISGVIYLAASRQAWLKEAVEKRTADFTRELTERRRAEDNLAKSEERLRLALKAANQGLYDLNVQTGETQVSPEYATMLGHDPAEFCETNAKWIERLHPDDRELTANIYRDYIAGKIPVYQVEFRQLTKSGDWKWILSLGMVVEWDAEGKPLRMLGTHTDISERKRNEEEMRHLAQAVHQAAETVVITDSSGVIEYVNPAFEAITGYSAQDAVGRNPSLLRSGKQDEAFYEEMWKTISSGRTWSGRIVNKRKDGTLYTEDCTISPVRNERGEIERFVAVKKDVTKELELEDRLRHAQKMEAVGQLAGGVAHDFNNLLQVINAYTSIALEQLEPDAPAKAKLENVAAAGERATRLAGQLLAFSRRQVLRLEDLDLNDVIGHLMKMLEWAAGNRVHVEFVPSRKPAVAHADRGQLEQVLMNLCINARDAMPEGGKLTIATQDAPEGEGQRGFVALSVADTGCGMDADTLEHIFEPFFTTKAKGKGTGLGLATVYGIVTQHNGTISTESEVGKGTKFTILLPGVELLSRKA